MVICQFPYAAQKQPIRQTSSLRPLQNAPFHPISTSGSNFYPRNTQCIPACPVECEAYSSGMVKIIAFLELEQKGTFFKDLSLCSIFEIWHERFGFTQRRTL